MAAITGGALAGPVELATGTRVRVVRAFPPGHFRTPAYVRGKQGEIVATSGRFPNPEELAYGRDGLPARILYRVRFRQDGLWPSDAGVAGDPIEAGTEGDTLDIDLYDHWLEVAR